MKFDQKNWMLPNATPQATSAGHTCSVSAVPH
jgi:hypothetical protein